MSFEELEAELDEAMKVVKINQAAFARNLALNGPRILAIFRYLLSFFEMNSIISIRNQKFIRSVKNQYISNKRVGDNLPLSALGSRLHAGRFHEAASQDTLYFADTVSTINREVHLDEATTPHTLLPVSVGLSRCLDLSDRARALENNVSLTTLMDIEWKTCNDLASIPSYSQLLAQEIARSGLEAILVPSARRTQGKNLVIFPENLRRGSFVRLEGNSHVLREKVRILVRNQSLIGRATDATFHNQELLPEAQ